MLRNIVVSMWAILKLIAVGKVLERGVDDAHNIYGKLQWPQKLVYFCASNSTN